LQSLGMRWEVAIPPEGSSGEAKTVSVDGDDWLSALTAGLSSSGIPDAPGKSGFAVLIHDDGVDVSDFGLGRRFTLRYLDARPRKADGAAASVLEPVRPSRAAIESTVPRVALATVPHTLLFKRDEDRDAKNAVTYRERVLAVAPQTPRAEVEKVLRSVFEELAASIADRPAGKFIHVTVFDAVFSGPPTRPALGALSWKDWRGTGPDVTFPSAHAPLPSTPTPPPKTAPAAAHAKAARGPEPKPVASPMVVPVTPKREAPAPAAPAPAPAPAVLPLDPALTSAPPLPGPKTLVDRPTPVPAEAADRPTPPPAERGERISWIPAATQAGRARKQSAEVLLATSAEELLAEVFEAMQDLYATRTREEAARFALTLSVQKVPCEAAAVLLHDLATGDLVYVAALGPGTDSLAGVRTAREHGLVGAAIQAGEALRVVDGSDPRLDADFDRMTGVQTKTILCAPILFDGRVLGAMELVNRRGDKPFADQESNLVSYIVEKLAEHLVSALPELAVD
jgi:GAF domain-containing protein